MDEPGIAQHAAADPPRLAPARDRAAALRPGALAYGALFTLLLPLLLWQWAAHARGLERLPGVHLPEVGIPLAFAGAALWLLAVIDLARRGGGLPMNAYPPPFYVTRGAYGLVRHPIYTGFGIAAAGVALWSGSPAALWLVLPTLLLAMVALVVGYEGRATRARFPYVRHSPRIRLPAASLAPPTAWDRVSVYLLALLPWLLAWSAVQWLGMPPDAFSTMLPLDGRVPVLEWTYPVYASTYLAVALLPLLLDTRRDLRRLAITANLATFTIGLVWLALPAAFVPRPFTPTSLWGELLELDRGWCTGMAAFPSFHVVWSLIAAHALGGRWNRARPWAWLWAAAVCLSCLTTGMHGVVDVAAALAVFPLFAAHRRAWLRARALTERVANGWREWRIGPVRVINHGFFAGIGCALGVAALLLLAPGQPRAAALALAFGALLGAGIWAQLLESSSGLLRPFGYYGAALGALAVALAGPWFGFSGMALLAALAVAAPWIQLVGRIRCLIQGCCHGCPADARTGIRYTHPRSRVSYLAHLAGRPLHPTPLYSMAANAVAGIILLRLWTLGAPRALVIGVYFIGNGLARFVEEGFRGEPQTAVLGGLRIYQWLAAAFVLAGAAVTTLATPPVGDVRAPDAPAILWVLAFLVIGTLAMGVDFPASNRRFSRLA